MTPLPDKGRLSLAASVSSQAGRELGLAGRTTTGRAALLTVWWRVRG